MKDIKANFPYENDAVSESAYTCVQKFLCELNELQEEMILKTIQEIGGETYHHITIHPSKVLEAFRNYTVTKPIVWGDGYDDKGELIYDMYDCPNCGETYELYYTHHKHCPECGQKLDWSEITE